MNKSNCIDLINLLFLMQLSLTESPESAFALRSKEVRMFAAIGVDGRVASGYTSINLANIQLMLHGRKDPVLSCGCDSGISFTKTQRYAAFPFHSSDPEK